MWSKSLHEIMFFGNIKLYENAENDYIMHIHYIMRVQTNERYKWFSSSRRKCVQEEQRQYNTNNLLDLDADKNNNKSLVINIFKVSHLFFCCVSGSWLPSEPSEAQY